MPQRIDSLWTRAYNGGYLHGGMYDGTARIRAQYRDKIVYEGVSELAAKCAITRANKAELANHNAAMLKAVEMGLL